MKRGQALRAPFFHTTMDGRIPRQNLMCSLEFLADRLVSTLVRRLQSIPSSRSEALTTIHDSLEPSFRRANSNACSTFSSFKPNSEPMTLKQLGSSILLVDGMLPLALSS